MNCAEFERRIHRLLDQRAAVTSDGPLERHADGCRCCRSTLDAYADLEAGLSAAEIPELRADFTERVVAAAERIEAEVGLASTTPGVRTIRMAIVAVAAAVLVALFPVVRQALHTPAAAPAQRLAATPGTALPNPLPLAADFPKLAFLSQDFPGVSADLVPEPMGMVREWMTSLARSREELLAPMDGIKDGIRPITSTLSGTIDVLRSAIPHGSPVTPSETTGDSARVPPTPRLDPTV